MKKIHILKTDKPSRLLKDLVDGTYQFKKEVLYGNRFELPLSIYITSDEVPKLDEWGINLANNVLFKDKGFTPDEYTKNNCRKIILTTDQDLIKDGVQSIDDEFLEWFIKNPNCEEVIVENYHGINTSIAEVNTISGDGSLNWQGKSDLRDYRIKIPKEEPKQEKNYSEVAKDEERQVNYKMLKSLKKYSRDELLAFGKSCFYKGFEKAEKDDANCYTAFREEIESLIKTFEKN